jgi:hypothetical protein
MLVSTYKSQGIPAQKTNAEPLPPWEGQMTFDCDPTVYGDESNYCSW